MVHCKRYSHLLLASVNLSVEGHSEYLRQVVSNGYDKHAFTTYMQYVFFWFTLKLLTNFTLSHSYFNLKKTRENSWVNGGVFDKGKTGAIKHALSSQEYSALSSILTFDEIPTKLISSSQQNRNFILTASKFKRIIIYTFKV